MLWETINFLQQVSVNNNKQWFDKHREEYKKLRAVFADFVMDIILETQEFDDQIGLLSPKNAMFRINKDIRFSKDKRPYKTFFSASISPGGRKHTLAGRYFDFGAKEELMVAAGEYFPDSKLLLRLRNYIADHPDEAEDFRKILNKTAFKNVFDSLMGESLTKPPRGFSRESLNLDLLRRKSFMILNKTKIKKNDTYDSLKEQIIQKFKLCTPFLDWLRRAQLS